MRKSAPRAADLHTMQWKRVVAKLNRAAAGGRAGNAPCLNPPDLTAPIAAGTARVLEKLAYAGPRRYRVHGTIGELVSTVRILITVRTLSPDMVRSTDRRKGISTRFCATVGLATLKLTQTMFENLIATTYQWGWIDR
jgi:hypothetical protein